MSLTSILNTYWLEEMIKREELNVALETFNLLLVDVWITTLKSIFIAAFLLDIDLSERSSKSDLKTRSVMLKSSKMRTYSAQNLWADHSIMKSEDLQSCEIITSEEVYKNHHSVVFQFSWASAAFASINVISTISATKRRTWMQWVVLVSIRKFSRFLLLLCKITQLASADLYADSENLEQRDSLHQQITLDNFHHDTKLSASSSYIIVSSVSSSSSTFSIVSHLSFSSRSSSNAIKNHFWPSFMSLVVDVSIKINAFSSS